MKNYLSLIISFLIGSFITILLFLGMTKGEAEIVVGESNTPAPGVIETFSGASVPTGYLLCDGRAVSRTTYSNLFSVIGTTYGVGDGSTTFNIPNLGGRVPVGKNTGTFNVLGHSDGKESITLSTSNLPAHTHSIPELTGTAASAGSHNHGWKGVVNVAYNSSGSYVGAIFGNDSAQSYINQGKGIQAAGAHTHSVTVNSTNAKATGSTGSGTAFTNMQPYLVVNYIIKY